MKKNITRKVKQSSLADSSMREEWSIARRHDRERIHSRVKRRAHLRSRCACRCRGTRLECSSPVAPSCSPLARDRSNVPTRDLALQQSCKDEFNRDNNNNCKLSSLLLIFSIRICFVRDFEKKYLHESRHDIRSGPANDEASFRGLAGFRHVFYMTDREPEFAHFHDLLQLKVPAATSFRDQQQIGEEEEMPLLGLHTLKSTTGFKTRDSWFLTLSKLLIFSKIDKCMRKYILILITFQDFPYRGELDWRF